MGRKTPQKGEKPVAHVFIIETENRTKELLAALVQEEIYLQTSDADAVVKYKVAKTQPRRGIVQQITGYK